jgi:hypothetical protein
VQHLAEHGALENSPRDIGKLISEVKQDIAEEERDYIQKFLWKEFGEQILRRATAGAPEWYKNQLLSRSFNAQNT